jgi:ubiquinone/menaquinone biosynthesis C-methylase UbiE
MSKGESFKDKVEYYFDEFSPKYDQTMHDRPHLVLTRLNTLLSEVKLPDDPVCLDVACGSGISTLKLHEICRGNAKVYGVDISEKMIDEANKIAKQREMKDVIYHKMDAEKLDFPDSTFDFVLSNMSLSYFPDKLKALSEVNRVLKPGGKFALSYTAAPCNQEGFEVAYNVALQHPELPEFLKAVEEVKSSLISLEDSIELFTEAGLGLSSIYGRHSIDWVDPTSLVSDQSNYWSLYRQALPSNSVDLIRLELLDASKRASIPGKGFKNTVYIIFAWGKKTS